MRKYVHNQTLPEDGVWVCEQRMNSVAWVCTSTAFHMGVLHAVEKPDNYACATCCG